jgi:hypothetical protein
MYYMMCPHTTVHVMYIHNTLYVHILQYMCPGNTTIYDVPHARMFTSSRAGHTATHGAGHTATGAASCVLLGHIH